MTKDECSEFKKLLKENVVKFEFRKKDGSIRKAEGTLSNGLLPPAYPVTKFKCTQIEWDTDESDRKSLPRTMTVAIDKAYLDETTDNGKKDDEYYEFLEEAIMGELEAASGFCVKGFKHELVEKRPRVRKEDMIVYYDLERKGFRSFNESQLISFTK